MLEPGIALHSIGFKVITDPNLGEMIDAGRQVRVAGLIDRELGTVRISPTFSSQEQRYTAAHELAHAILHPSMSGLHRDRVVSGPCPRKDKREVEADKFASCFLIPARLLLNRFQLCFGSQFLRLNEDTVYGLSIPNIDVAVRRFRNTRDLSLAIATTSSFMGRPFDSLSKYFRVSQTAMAIRLEEVGLIDDMSLRKAW
jgi:Zn-dependent peptidase ImmA (M78 family)